MTCISYHLTSSGVSFNVTTILRIPLQLDAYNDARMNKSHTHHPLLIIKKSMRTVDGFSSIQPLCSSPLCRCSLYLILFYFI